MRLKVHNAKSSLMILIFLCLNFSESLSTNYYPPISLLTVENISQTNWNTSDYNFDLKIGFSVDMFVDSKWITVQIVKLDLLQLGYNYDGLDDFISFNLFKYEGITIINDFWVKANIMVLIVVKVLI